MKKLTHLEMANWLWKNKCATLTDYDLLVVSGVRNASKKNPSKEDLMYIERLYERYFSDSSKLQDEREEELAASEAEEFLPTEEEE